MIRIIALIPLLTLPFSAFAVEPTPKTGTGTAPEKEVMGAIKFEDKPAVPPEALEKPETAPPPAKARPAPKAAPAKPAADRSPGEHYFGAFGVLGVPHPINYGLAYVHSSGLWSAQVATGTFSTTIDEVDAKLDNIEVGLRWHPGAGSFFVGALYGQHKVSAEKTEFISEGLFSGNVTATGEVKADYITPHIGWMWGAQNGGFFMSFELGYQAPTNVKVTVDSDAPQIVKDNSEDYQEIAKDVRDDAEKYGKMGLPYVALLKLGWLF